MKSLPYRWFTDSSQAARLTLNRVGGESIECGPGDNIFTPKGERVIRDIHEDVTRIYFTRNRDGSPD